MADGSPMTVGKSDIEAVYPYMPAAGVDRQFAGVQPGAYCDPSMRQLRSRLIPFRYSTAALRFTRDAITGHLSIATGGPATFRLFGAGVGEDGSTMGMSGVAPDLALTETETDALEKGALVESGMLFRAVGFAITLGAPWVTGVATNMAPRQYPAWLEEYVPRLQRAVSDGGSFEFTHGQQACRYNLGRPSFYGSSSSVAEVQSSINIPGEFWFLAVEDVSSGNSDPSKLTVTFTMPHSTRIDNNALTPTVGDVIVPLTVQVMGFPQCGDVATVNQDVIDAAVQRGIEMGVAKALAKLNK